MVFTTIVGMWAIGQRIKVHIVGLARKRTYFAGKKHNHLVLWYTNHFMSPQGPTSCQIGPLQDLVT